jgi:hypothetical protein
MYVSNPDSSIALAIVLLPTVQSEQAPRNVAPLTQEPSPSFHSFLWRLLAGFILCISLGGLMAAFLWFCARTFG